MANIVMSIATNVANYLAGQAFREVQYFLSINNIINDLENEKEALISERDDLLIRVTRAKERAEIIEKLVEKWLNDVENLLTEVENLEQRMDTDNNCFQGWCPTWKRYLLCKQMVEKIAAMREFKGKSNIGPFSYPAPLPDFIDHFKSTKMAYNKLLEALQDDCVYMIGVYGVGGCGKTTLVMEAGKMAEKLNMFDNVIFISVSPIPNIRDIQDQMADMLHIKLEELSEEGRAQCLWLSLKEKKRILVIIDDLWREFNLMDIGIRLDNVNKGAWKILVTTRNMRVCASMDCQIMIHLELLFEEESWTLFQKHANIDDEFSESLDGVPQKLCNECMGLPVAIITMASSLKGKHKTEWVLALDKLRNSEAFDDHEEGVRAALSCLELSYNYLKNKEAELLFLMCSVFPEDYNIPIEDLMRYAIGLGVGGISSLKSKRSLIQAGINELLDSCLLMPSEYSEDCVMMHGIVRDAALRIAKRSENHKILVNFHKPLSTLADDDSIRDCFAVSSWHNENPIFHQLHAPNLEMLLLNINTSRSSNSFNLSHLTFEGIEGLKVFALTSASYNFNLPPSTQLLTNVRTLRLNGLELGDISFIASLTTLEVLDLRGCDFDELPNEIGKLRRLKLLDLSRCHIFQKVYNGAIGKCSQLEELYALECKQEYLYQSQSVVDIVTLPKLQRLVMQATSMNIPHYGKSSTSIGLMDFNISKLRAFKRNILQIAETIEFERLHGGCENIIPDMVGVVGGMKYLTTLYLNHCPEIECIFDATSDLKVDDSIPELVELRLERMENLKELFRGPPLQVQHYFEKLEILDMWDCVHLHSIFPWECNLQNLKSLTIWGCVSTEILFITSVAQSMLQLEKLIIKGCHELKHVIASGREHGCNTSEQIVPAPRNSHFLMPSLRQVYIHDCPKLESIFPICYVEGLA